MLTQGGVTYWFFALGSLLFAIWLARYLFR